MKRACSVFLLGGLLFAAAAVGALAKVPGEVVSLFQKRCTECHKGKFPPQSLSWEANKIETAIDRSSQEAPELKIIDTASPESSYVLKKVRGDSGIKGTRMPPGQTLSAAEIKVLEAWITGLKKSPAPASSAGSPGDDTPWSATQAPAGGTAKPRPFDTPAFWGPRLINLPTTTTPDKGDFRIQISHRFDDRFEEGLSDFFGLDGYANVYLAAGYGITDNLAVSVGRARLFREFELAADWLVAEQGVTAGLPFSATLHAGVSLATEPDPNEARFNAAISLARQFTRRFSVLVVPSLATNTDPVPLGTDSTFVLGLGARYMVLRDFSVIVEWVPVLAGYKGIESGWGLGLEKKIGGHVFQVFFNNALGQTPAQYLPGGNYRLADLDFRVGFNIFRTF